MSCKQSDNTRNRRNRTPADARLPMTADAILKDFTHYFGRMLGRRTIRTRSPFLYQAVVLRGATGSWNAGPETRNRDGTRPYRRTALPISLEFLMGRLLHNALYSNRHRGRDARGARPPRPRSRRPSLNANGTRASATAALAGSLPASSTAAQRLLPVIGYGIRYQYGMFHQRIENGYQVEEPDSWLREGFPWEIERIEFAQTIQFGGYTTTYRDRRQAVRPATRWVDTHDVLAIPYDIPVPGFRNDSREHAATVVSGGDR